MHFFASFITLHFDFSFFFFLLLFTSLVPFITFDSLSLRQTGTNGTVFFFFQMSFFSSFKVEN